MAEVKKAQPWAGDHQRQDTASAQGMRGFYLGEELTGWMWEGSVDTRESWAHGERNHSAWCLFHHVLCHRKEHGCSRDLWLSQRTPGQGVWLGAKIPQWCKRHWASQSKSHRELLITNPAAMAEEVLGCRLLLGQCSGAASRHTCSALPRALAFGSCQWWDTRWGEDLV